MLFQRMLPPAAAPIYLNNIITGIIGYLRGQNEINRFESELKEYFQVKHCFLLSSGKAALTSILRALHRISPDRDEVLIPSFTCYSLPAAIVRAKLKIRLCDINPATLDFDFAELQRNLQSKNRLLTIVCPHLLGLPANIAKIREILDDPKIPVIEDAAQAMGGVVKNQHLGTLGDVGFFSLGRGKAFSTVEGGVIITNSDKLAGNLKSNTRELTAQSGIHTLKLSAYALILSTLAHPSLFWIPKSMPRLRLGETIYDPQFSIQHFSPFQAGLARNWQKRITSLQYIRKQNVLYWKKTLIRFPWLQAILIRNESNEELPLLRLPVLVQSSSLRDVVFEISEKKGLGIMHLYPDSIDKIDKLELEHKGQTFPGAIECARRLVTFPVHGFVTQKDRQRAIDCLETVQVMNLS